MTVFILYYLVLLIYKWIVLGCGKTILYNYVKELVEQIFKKASEESSDLDLPPRNVILPTSSSWVT